MCWTKTVVSVCILALLLAGCATPTTEPAPVASSTVESPPTEMPVTEMPTTEPAPVASSTVESPPTEMPVAEMPTTEPAPAASEMPGSLVAEVSAIEIPLKGPVAQAWAEVSGMAWYGDYLILLPQYPDFAIKEGDGAVFALPKSDLLAYLDGSLAGPLEPVPIPFLAPGLASQIDGFEGYEAITFLGDQAFLTIEAKTADGMRGYLVSGRMAPDLSTLVLNPAVLAEIASQPEMGNKSEEALLVAGDRLVTIYEINGAAINASPVAHLFDTQLVPAGTILFPNVEYRITDATALDDEGRFWAINYFFPGDTELLPAGDPLADRYGQGPTHAQAQAVERLLEFNYSESGIGLADRPPIQLELMNTAIGGLSRNWEGLVRLDERGFLLVTDLFPGTILGFVPAPGEE